MDGFEKMCCGVCGISHWVPDEFIRERRENGGGWHCPNGHPRVFRQSMVDKLQNRLEAKNRELEHAWVKADEAVRRLSAIKGVVTRMKNRAAAGICPCCNRSFQNLKRHMHSKHPDYSKEEVA